MEESSLAYIVAPFTGWLMAQIIKIIIQKRLGFNLHGATQSGGMPSSHATFVAALTSAIAIGEGIDSALFAISLAISSIVIYDATDVRRTTGQQTDLINKLAENNKLNNRIEHDARGHTVPEVIVGIVVGILIGLISVIIL